ncbi:hypothetical protein [Chryseobacterium flavum]|uniref:hypothetical protein n=1 Tax=Chryseobacterium flavum TaxID=415851 RepID=UPI0028AA7887|nr:hypothetical protein [Chryseobacterium flavum]
MTDIALLYSVDRFMNEARSVTNFIGIAVAGAVISKLNPQKRLPLSDNIVNSEKTPY